MWGIDKMIDIHTHVLPRIDDGPRDWETSLGMLADSVKLDVKKVIATPHYYPWRRNVSPEEVREKCRQAKEKLQEEYGLEIEVYAGHEIYYSVDTLQKLKSGEMLTLADSNYVLLEFSDEEPFTVIYRAVREFTEHGYTPILAHVERYKNLYKESNLVAVKENGALLQVNVESLKDGIWDKKSQWVKKQLKKETIDFLASDMHNSTDRPPYTEENLQRIRKMVEPRYINRLMCDNCEKIILNLR